MLQSEALQQLCIPPALKRRKEGLTAQDFREYKGWKTQRVVQVLGVTAGPAP